MICSIHTSQYTDIGVSFDTYRDIKTVSRSIIIHYLKKWLMHTTFCLQYFHSKLNGANVQFNTRLVLQINVGQI